MPTAVNGGGTWKLVTTGNSYTCGIKSDGTVWCWGYNFYGSLGDNSTTQRLIPTAVNGGGTWKLVAAFGVSIHTCGIKSDDALWCWGYNGTGQLGDNSTTDRLVPTAVNGGGAWSLVKLGSDHSCGIGSGGTLLCWGFNGYNQLTATEFSSSFRTTGVQTVCSDPVGKAGDVVFNNVSGVMQYCDGVTWVRVGK